MPTDTQTTISFRARVTAAVSATVENRAEALASNADRVAASATFVVAGSAPPGALYLPLIQRSGTANAAGVAAATPTPPAAATIDAALQPIFLPMVQQ